MVAFCIAEDSCVLHFYFQIKGIQIVLSINNDAEICAGFRELHERRLYLAGENDQAANGYRVITASLDCCNFRMCTATDTLLLPPDTRKVTAAIADHGCTICRKPCPHKLTVFAFLHPLTCFGIDTLHQESISPCVHTIASFTFAGHTWAKELSHAKFIVGGDVEQFPNFRRVSHGHGSAPNSPILSFVSLKSTPRSR